MTNMLINIYLSKEDSGDNTRRQLASGLILDAFLHIKYVTLTVEMPLAATLSQEVAVFGKCPKSSKTIQSPKVNDHY